MNCPVCDKVECPCPEQAKAQAAAVNSAWEAILPRIVTTMPNAVKFTLENLYLAAYANGRMEQMEREKKRIGEMFKEEPRQPCAECAREAADIDPDLAPNWKDDPDAEASAAEEHRRQMREDR